MDTLVQGQQANVTETRGGTNIAPTSVRSLSLGDILAKKPQQRALVSVRADTSLEQVSKLLKEHRIIAVPVFGGTDSPRFLGFIDTMDLLKYVARDFYQREKELKSSCLHGFAFSSVASVTAGELLQHLNRTPPDGVFDSLDTLELAITELANHKRIIIKSGTEYKVLTQSDVVKHLFSILPQLHISMDYTMVNELRLVSMPINSPINIPSIHPSWSAIESFYFMHSKNLECAAVVEDRDGKLLGNLSASDLRGITTDKMEMLKDPVFDFVQATTGKPPRAPVTCIPTDPINNVMAKAIRHSVHRVWIVDNTQRPIGLVSYRDMINACLRY